MTEMKYKRNFCIVAHIDHGKSTLADRLIQKAKIIDDRQMKNQILDNMDIERERGITIKSQAVTIPYRAKDGHDYELNFVDTPGHVDFSYEVSRAIASCEGALLLIDASQGVESQTVSNLYMAMEQDLTIVPVINKIDMPSAMPDEVEDEIIELIGCDRSEIIRASGKTGEGVEDILNAVVLDLRDTDSGHPGLACQLVPVKASLLAELPDLTAYDSLYHVIPPTYTGSFPRSTFSPQKQCPQYSQMPSGQ